MLPGSLIKTALEFMGIDPASCNCVERAAQMDSWGVEGCIANQSIIVGWFVEEGRRHNVVDSHSPQFRNLVRAGVSLAIRRSQELIALESAGESDGQWESLAKTPPAASATLGSDELGDDEAEDESNIDDTDLE